MNRTAKSAAVETADALRGGCGCLIPLREVSEAAGRSGLLDDIVTRHVHELGIVVAQDWRGDPAVPVADARRLREAIEGHLADHDARWREYTRYVEAEQQKAQEARMAAALKARAEEEEEQRQWSDAQRKAWEAKRAEDLAEAERQRRERQGAPVPFAEFKTGKAS